MKVALAFAIGILFAASLPFVVRAAGTDGSSTSAAGTVGVNKQGVQGGVSVKTGKVNSSARRVSHRKHVHRRHAFN